MQRLLAIFTLVAVLLSGCTALDAPAPIGTAAPATPNAAVEVTPVEVAANDEHAAAVDELVAQFDEPSATNGDLLVLYGQVTDVNGAPVPNVVIEIWQTDAAGVYDHPGDPATASRDMTFQFYGSAMTNADGWYAFRTILPGEYEPRPRHIHYKVKQNGVELLTSQFYFSEDIADVEDEGMFRAVGDSGDLLLLQLVADDGDLLANGPIVVDTGIGGGTLPLTPAQAEGPYYPVVSLANYDNDLARLP